MSIALDWEAQSLSNHLRMSLRAFRDLLAVVGPMIERQDSKFREAISSEARLALTIWRLAYGESFKALGHRFRVGKSTAVEIFNECIDAINTLIVPQEIIIPTGPDLQKVMDDFAAVGFPGCVGAIDGSVIAMIRPVQWESQWYNGHYGVHGTKLQAVVSRGCRFLDIYVGETCRLHDSALLQRSPLFSAITTGRVFSQPLTRLPGGQHVRPYILGDSAYANSAWCVAPFREGRNFTDEHRSFNFKHSQARVVVEHAFGLLKRRFRILGYSMDYALDLDNAHLWRVPDIVTACCGLHNFLQARREAEPPPAPANEPGRRRWWGEFANEAPPGVELETETRSALYNNRNILFRNE